MTVWVEIAVRSFFMQCVQIFGVMRLLHRPVPRWRLVSFAALLTFAHVFLIDVVPVEELRFVLVSVVRLASFIWFFETEVFPDALIAYLVPLSLNTLGGLFFPALFTHYLPGILENRWAVMLLGPAAEYTAYLPSIMLACYYLLSDRPQGVEGAEENRTSLHLAWSLVFLHYALVLPSRAHPEVHRRSQFKLFRPLRRLPHRFSPPRVHAASILPQRA